MTEAVWRASAAICMTLLGGSLATEAEKPRQTNGKMELLTLRSKIFANTRTVRVWLPPGYQEEAQRTHRYPVFYFTDGVAAFRGRQLDRVAEKLTKSGKIVPTIFVGIDNGGSTKESKDPGSDRANEYLPYPDDSLQPPVPSPHGKLFPAFLETEVRPLVESRYRTTDEVGLAGASYGGAIAVYTVMENPGRYRWLLIESPSLYIGGDELLHRAEIFRQWPQRVYVGAGTDEGEGDAKREMVDDVTQFVNSMTRETAKCLVLIPGAEHGEGAWHARLPTALEFLLGKGTCPKPKSGPEGRTGTSSPR
jgi:predicted alpha/beta superfamily hydrolase